MSSWFSLPLLNPFKSNDDDGAAAATATAVYDGEKPSDSDPNFSSIKEDFSAISQTFTHHLRGVASFLTPPSPPPSSTQSEQHSEKFIGIKSDLVEIGDSLKSSVSEISKLASNLLHFGDNEVNDREKNEYDDEEEEEEEEEEIVGVTDDVVDFVSTISQRDQLWTDFPISLPSDFSMSDSQKEHVASIVQFVPGLESLRQKVCHELSDGQFWMIYFVLLLPRLNGNDLEMLSTPEVVEVRETLLLQLQSKKDSQPEASKDSETVDASEKDVEISGQQVSESKLEEKNISETANASQDKDSLHGEKRQEPLDEEKTKNTTSYADKNEDDVSFSDLEDDDTDLSDRLQGSKPPHRKKVSSSSESHEWIQLNENSKAQGSQQKAGQSIHRDKDSEGDESSDWLTVDDIDSDSLATN
ncbi:stress response protein NST1 [Capsicum galapagoense]